MPLQSTDVGMERPMVKLEDILEGIEMSHDECQAYLDLRTGRVEYIDDDTQWALDHEDDPADLPDWQSPIVEITRLIDADEEGERFLPLPNQFDVHEWQMMADFVQTLDDEAIRHQLSNACRGGGAFRCFKDMAHRLGVEAKWFACREEQYRRFAVDWCEVNNIPWE
ncbi:MAG: hypothetical protein GC162_00435 [Planctomycetes bacterium]|nr:hypothetical protein [Planctomycetota bacterium]